MTTNHQICSKCATRFRPISCNLARVTSKADGFFDDPEAHCQRWRWLNFEIATPAMMEMKSGELSGVMDKPLSAAEATWKRSEHRKVRFLVLTNWRTNRMRQSIIIHFIPISFVSVCVISLSVSSELLNNTVRSVVKYSF